MISEFDKNNVGQIIRGHGDWFGAKLLRLIRDADDINIEKLREAFPGHVWAYETWRYGGQDDE